MMAVTAIARAPPRVTRNAARPRGAPPRCPPKAPRAARLTSESTAARACDLAELTLRAIAALRLLSPRTALPTNPTLGRMLDGDFERALACGVDTLLEDVSPPDPQPFSRLPVSVRRVPRPLRSRTARWLESVQRARMRPPA